MKHFRVETGEGGSGTVSSLCPSFRNVLKHWEKCCVTGRRHAGLFVWTLQGYTEAGHFPYTLRFLLAWWHDLFPLSESSTITIKTRKTGAKRVRIIDGLGLIRLFFLIPRTLLLSFWCDACSISAIGESNGKSQLGKYFQNSYALERYGG